jgi:ureidoglycolate hydrolase
MAEGARRLVAGRIEPEAWAPFGWVPVPDTDPSDGASRLEYEWGDPHVNVISHAPDEVERDGAGLLVDRMYRHDTHTQVLLALNGPSVLAVAPADADLSTAAGLDAVRAFRLEKLDAVVLHRGTWHWGPFPLGDEPVLLFNVQGLGYARDNASADLGANGVHFLVESEG